MMANFIRAIFLFCLLLVVSCGDGGVLPDVIGDDMKEAVELVKSANEDLKQIKKLHNENEGKVNDIQIAMKSSKILEVRRLAKEAVSKINEGISIGNKAIKKLEEAQDLKINDNFQKYLRLKTESLKKLVEAFEFRRQLAKSLSEEFVMINPEKINELKADMMKKEKRFGELIKEGQDKSQEANQLAKDILKRDDF